MKTIMARTPIIPLAYSEKHKAQPKELLVDYDNGNIYVVSAHDKSIIFDITAKIYEQLEGMSGDNIEITIEGIGTVQLTEILKQLQIEINESIQAIETGDEIVYVGKENILDGKSLGVINKRIQLKGFSSAGTHMIPRKGENGELEWIDLPKLPDISIGSGGSVSNPTDGEITEVHIIEPLNDKLYLRASKRQKSVNLDRNCIVILPRVLDAYSEIYWYVRTNSFCPLLRFTSNVIWANSSDTQPFPNSHQMYKFVSLDAGETWLAEIVHYNKTSVDEVVYMSHLEDNYYPKTYIVDNIYTKEEVNEKIQSIDLMNPSDYYDKTETHEIFYDKGEVDTKINNIEVNVGDIDLENYYNKFEVDNLIGQIPVVDESKLLSKDEATQAYYNKSQVDQIARETYDKAITDVQIPVDVIRRSELETRYYDKVEVDGLVDSVVELIPDNLDLSNYVTNDKLTTDYYNKVEVDNKISQVNPSDVDLSNYVTNEKLVDEYYNKLEVDSKISSIPQPDLGDYVTNTSLNENYYDKLQVDEKVSSELTAYVTNTSLTENYYDKPQIDEKLTNLSPEVDLSGVVKTEYLEENYYDKVQVDAKISSVEVSGVDLTNYYTKQEIDDNFYDVGEADEKFYDKNKINEYVQFLDDKHYDKDETENMMSWQIEGVGVSPINK